MPQIADVARRIIDVGAIGLTCAKLAEAEVFAAAGISDLLIANLIAGPRKVERLVALRRSADPILCLDHLDQALPISQAMQDAVSECGPFWKSTSGWPGRASRRGGRPLSWPRKWLSCRDRAGRCHGL